MNRRSFQNEVGTGLVTGLFSALLLNTVATVFQFFRGKEESHGGKGTSCPHKDPRIDQMAFPGMFLHLVFGNPASFTNNSNIWYSCNDLVQDVHRWCKGKCTLTKQRAISRGEWYRCNVYTLRWRCILVGVFPLWVTCIQVACILTQAISNLWKQEPGETAISIATQVSNDYPRLPCGSRWCRFARKCDPFNTMNSLMDCCIQNTR